MLLGLVFLLMVSGSAFAVTVDFRAQPLASFLALVYGDILKTPYVLDDRLADRKVTVQYRDAHPAAVKKLVESYLQKIGVDVKEDQGVVYFFPRDVASLPSLPAVSTISPPVFRDLSPGAASLSLTADLKPVVQPVSELVDSSGVDGAEVALKLLNVTATRLNGRYLLVGPRDGIDRAKDVLSALRVDGRVLDVRILVVEYSSTQNDARGIAGAINLLSGKLGISIGAVAGVASTSGGIHFKNATIDAVLGVLDTSSGFRLLQDAQLRVRTGHAGSLQVGEQVPTLGQTTLDNQNRSIQSVVYQAAGLSVQVQPLLFGEVVQSDVKVSLSSFQSNSTSGIDSPSKKERSVISQVEVRLGEVTCVGGLQQENQSSNGLSLFGLSLSNARSSSSGTILVFLSFSMPLPG